MYDNNAIIIFDNSKYFYHLFLFQYDNNNVITTISFLGLYPYYQN